MTEDNGKLLSENTITLQNGIRMPQIGLGTYQMDEQDLKNAIPAALDAGYRCFDTAASYRNEQYLGQILKKEIFSRGITREDIFIISKLRPADHGYDAAAAALKKSANLLGGYIDLYLIHWPGVAKKPPGDVIHSSMRAESWHAFQDALDDGIFVRSIGVSNYNIMHLEDMMHSSSYRIAPMVNQIEIHPAHHPRDLTAYCEERGIHIQAYSSLGKGELLKDEVVDRFPRLIEIAERVCQGSSFPLSSLFLKWAIQRGFSVLPKSTNPDRIRLNYAACVIEEYILSSHEIAYIDQIQDIMPMKYCWDSSVVL